MKESNFMIKGGNYATVDYALLCEKGLTLKAKGLYAYLVSKPADWNFAATRIAKESNDGKRSVLSAIKELISFGWLTYEKLPTGRSLYTLYRTPLAEADREPKKKQGGRPNFFPTEAKNPKCQKRTVLDWHRGNSAPISKKVLKQKGIPVNIAKQGFALDLPTLLFKPTNTGETKEVPDFPAQLLAVVGGLFADRFASYDQRSRTERAAAERLIDLRGYDGAEALVKRAHGLVGVPYAPSATTLYEIDKKALKIDAYVPAQERGYAPGIERI